MPFSTARPAAAASSVFGTAPMPTTTRSAGMIGAVRQARRLSAVIAAMRAPKWKVTPSARWRACEHRGDLGRHAAGQQPRQRLDHGDLGAELAGRGGELEADEAAADHREPPAGAERGADAGGVVERAQHRDGRAVGAGQRQRPRPGAGGEQQAGVGQIASPSSQRDDAARRGRWRRRWRRGGSRCRRSARRSAPPIAFGAGASAVIASLESGGRS